MLTSSGAQLSTGSSATLNFTGGISLTFGLGSIQISGVVSGQQYLVTVIGANTFASVVVGGYVMATPSIFFFSVFEVEQSFREVPYLDWIPNSGSWQ
jgi:hypothetical protein